MYNYFVYYVIKGVSLFTPNEYKRSCIQLNFKLSNIDNIYKLEEKIRKDIGSDVTVLAFSLLEDEE